MCVRVSVCVAVRCQTQGSALIINQQLARLYVAKLFGEGVAPLACDDHLAAAVCKYACVASCEAAIRM